MGSIALIGYQSRRRTTVNSNPEPESLKQSDVMFCSGNLLWQHQWWDILTSVFLWDNSSSMVRGDILQGQLLISHKKNLAWACAFGYRSIVSWDHWMTIYLKKKKEDIYGKNRFLFSDIFDRTLTWYPL